MSIFNVSPKKEKELMERRQEGFVAEEKKRIEKIRRQKRKRANSGKAKMIDSRNKANQPDRL